LEIAVASYKRVIPSHIAARNLRLCLVALLMQPEILHSVRSFRMT